MPRLVYGRGAGPNDCTDANGCDIVWLPKKPFPITVALCYSTLLYHLLFFLQEVQGGAAKWAENEGILQQLVEV